MSAGQVHVLNKMIGRLQGRIRERDAKAVVAEVVWISDDHVSAEVASSDSLLLLPPSLFHPDAAVGDRFRVTVEAVQ